MSMSLLIRFQWDVAVGALFALDILLIKLSMGFFYLRVLTAQWQKIVCYIMMIVSTLINLDLFFFTLFSCHGYSPIHYAEYLVHGRCPHGRSNTKTFEGQMYSQSAINILTDFVFLILPIPAVLKAN